MLGPDSKVPPSLAVTRDCISSRSLEKSEGGSGLRRWFKIEERLFRISWANEGAESLGWRVGDETFRRLRSSVQNLGLPETQSNDNSKLTPKVSKDQDDG